MTQTPIFVPLRRTCYIRVLSFTFCRNIVLKFSSVTHVNQNVFVSVSTRLRSGVFLATTTVANSLGESDLVSPFLSLVDRYFARVSKEAL